MNESGQESACGCSSPLTLPESFHIHTSASPDGKGLSQDTSWVQPGRQSFTGRGMPRIM
jgi:hypothetical protein